MKPHMSIQKTIFIIFFISVLVGEVSAQDSIPLNLEVAVRMAIENNTEVAIANYSVETAEYAKKEAFGSVLPKFYLGANYFRNIDRPVIFLPDAFGMGAVRQN